MSFWSTECFQNLHRCLFCVFFIKAVEKCGAPCTEDQFTCANGCCLDPGLECDQTKQCSDGSDELKCEDCEQWRCKLCFHAGFFFHKLKKNISQQKYWFNTMSCVILVENKFRILLQIPLDEQKGKFLHRCHMLETFHSAPLNKNIPTSSCN